MTCHSEDGRILYPWTMKDAADLWNKYFSQKFGWRSYTHGKSNSASKSAFIQEIGLMGAGGVVLIFLTTFGPGMSFLNVFYPHSADRGSLKRHRENCGKGLRPPPVRGARARSPSPKRCALPRSRARAAPG